MSTPAVWSHDNMHITAPWIIQEESSNKHYSQTTITFFNGQHDSFSSNPYQQGLGGGKNQEWNKFVPKIGQTLVEHPEIGIHMRELTYELDNIKRTGFPIYLDPKTASYRDVAIHAKIRQYLNDSTIEKNLRYARFMETHPVPVNFRNLTPEDFIRHIDYRLEMEQPPATPNAIKHEKKAILMFLRAYNLYSDQWKQLVKTPPIYDNEDNIEVPFPSIVNELYHATYSEDKYENVLLQTVVFLGFNFGMRPPSEICNLDLDDLVVNKDGTGYIRIHEDKKRGKQRIIIPFNKNILSSSVFRTPKNYIDKWRGKAATNSSGNALFLQPNGTRITGKYLRDHITPIGKQIAGPFFHLYTMRHTCATYLYEYTRELEIVRRRLGHRKPSTTIIYVHIADSIKRQVGKRNLFNLALRSHYKSAGGKPRSIEQEKDCWPKNRQSLTFSPRETGGPGRI
jgi:integrase